MMLGGGGGGPGRLDRQIGLLAGELWGQMAVSKCVWLKQGGSGPQMAGRQAREEGLVGRTIP